MHRGAANAAEYLPASQETHRAPAVLYMPAPQLLQFSFCNVYPALHLQSAEDGLPASEFEFVGHDRHASIVTWRPVVYVPAAHASHPPLLATPHKPALQIQCVSLVLAAGESEFAGQS